MTKISNVEDGAVYQGYDSLAASEWCTPSFLGCSACISASAVKGQVTITIGLKTPFGNVNKSFSFNTNTSFTWQPFSKFKITVSITNFNEASGVFSFDLGLNPCIDVPFLGWKCFNYSHTFTVPLLLAGIENEIDDSQFVSLLTLHASGSLNEPCHCDDTASSPLLKGDIYNNYLNSQAGFPTIPITQCLPIPTVQCVPTITSCVTGISPICAAQQGANANAATLPTIPITQCLPIPTVQCVPTITSCITGISPICLAQQGTDAKTAAGFPTIPITQCLPIPTVQCVPTITSCVTGISPICLAQQGGGTNAAAFPTIPITQCITIPTVQCIPTITSCVTGISPICAAQQGADANTAAFPTIPIAQCFPIPTVKCIPTITSCVTGISPICLAQQGAGTNASAFPTIPITQCITIPTVQCVPTITSCVTGISPICAAQQGADLKANLGSGAEARTLVCFPTFPPICRSVGADANAAAVPTLPVNQCIPTVSCVPTLSCIPTVSCTGIPFICS
ncbi:MAG: hypothetical protein EOO44_07530 [Flavobacterium sp.]|nr:MAG: hypothetical protein EOO44_07530 [Flavobacterium sp.]